MAHYKNAGLPTLIVYKGGKMVTSAVRCTDVLPKHFSDLDVARLLQAYEQHALKCALQSGTTGPTDATRCNAVVLLADR